MQPAAHLNILVTANTSPAVRQLQRTDAQLRQTTAHAERMSGTFKTFAKGAAAGFGIAAATAGLTKATQTFVGFDKAMRNVNSIAQLSETRFKALEKRVLALAGPTAQAPETLAAGLYDLVSSGFDANEAVQILGKSARAATAGLTDTATATKAVAAVLNAYRLQAADAGKVSDSLFQTVNLGVLTFEELAQNIGDTLPFAATLKVSLNEVGAATATMTKQGLGAAETFTRIRNLLQTLIKPNADLKRAFDELGVASGEQLIKQRGFQGALEALISTTDGSKAAVAKLFPNIRALGGAMALTGTNARSAEKDLANMGKTSGATSRALSEQSKSISYQWRQLSAQAAVLAIQIGTKTTPVVLAIVKAMVTAERVTDRWREAVKRGLVNAWEAAARVFGNVMAAIIRGFGKLFDLASHLPGIGGKFGDLSDRANKAAASIDRLGEHSKDAGSQARGAANRVNFLTKAIAGLPKSKSITIDVGLALKSWDRLQPPTQLLGGGGDGWGLEQKITSQAQKAAQDKANKDPSGLFGAMKGGPIDLKGANANLAPFAMLGSTFGLSVVSGFRPGAITSSGNVSYHASGRAIDVDKGTAGQMLAYAKMMAATFGGKLKELIHTPLGFSIKNGRRVAPYAQSEHYDHVHVAMRRGGMVTGGKPSGDTVPALLERDEGVINRKAVKALGGPSAIDAINSMVPRFQKGGVAGRSGPSNLLAGLDKVFPAHYLGQPGAQLSVNQVRAVAEKWGGLSPARALQAEQITEGESSRHPGIIGRDPGGTLGIGLWQITRGVQGALGKSWIDSRGGDTGMRNPRKNAEVMSIMSGKGSSWSNWYGTRFLKPLQSNVQSVFGAAGAATAPTARPKKPKPHRAILTRLRGVDLPNILGPSAKQLRQRIAVLRRAADIAADMATRAEDLGAPVGGKDQMGWLNEELGHLFGLRNALVDAESLVEKQRDAYTRAIEKAHKQLKKIQDAIQDAAKKRRKLVGELHAEKQRPKPNRRKVSDLTRRIAKIDRNQATRVAERKTIHEAIPGWEKGRKGLNTRRGDLLSTLEGVQGIGSPLAHLARLPAMGVLGGEILQVQLALRQAQAPIDSITDTSGTTADTTQVDLLKQLLREANLRTAVSERQFDIFKNFDATSGAGPFMGAFARGGVALVGERGPELAHLPSGTRVHSTTDTQAMLSPNWQIIVNGDIVNVPRGKQPIETRQLHARNIRASNRSPLPGRGGGGF